MPTIFSWRLLFFDAYYVGAYPEEMIRFDEKKLFTKRVAGIKREDCISKTKVCDQTENMFKIKILNLNELFV